MRTDLSRQSVRERKTQNEAKPSSSFRRKNEGMASFYLGQHHLQGMVGDVERRNVSILGFTLQQQALNRRSITDLDYGI